MSDKQCSGCGNRKHHPNDATDKIRVLQWNILADGLGRDGFLSTEFHPIREREDESCTPYTPNEFMSLVRTAKETDRKNGSLDRMEKVKKATKSLKKLEKDSPAHRKAKDDVAALRREIESTSQLVRLKQRFGESPELEQVDKEVVAWSERFSRIKSIVMESDADVITFQEMDHLQEFVDDPDFGRIYTCSLIEKEKHHEYYRPAKYGDDPNEDVLRTDNYVQRLLDAKVSFAPKSYSSAARFRVEREKRGETSSVPVDDDGVAVFWRRGRFRPVELGFLCYSNLPEETHKREAAVAVSLESVQTNDQIHVLTAHLPSGDEQGKERLRLRVLEGNGTCVAKRLVHDGKSGWRSSSYEKVDGVEFGENDGILEFVRHYAARRSKERPSSSTTVFASDINSAPTFPLVSTVEGDDQKKKTNTWRSILDAVPGMRCSWVTTGFLNEEGDPVSSLKVPVSTNKMRGPSSDQPAKIGEHKCELIDHVFANNEEQKCEIVEHVGEIKVAPKLYEDGGVQAQLELIPTKEMPSDHYPVIVDFVSSGRKSDP